MIADIAFYMDGTVEDRLSQIIASESPLRLESKFLYYYFLKSQDAVLDNKFLYSAPDNDIMPRSILHIEAQKALDFRPGIELSYSGCDLNPEKIMAFRRIMDYFVSNEIPLYMTATDECGEETLIKGCNPLTNTEIQNSNFKTTLSKLLE